MSLAMTRSERETFLSAVHVGVISIERAGMDPLAVPIWYDFDPAIGVWVITGKDSEKGRGGAAPRRGARGAPPAAPPPTPTPPRAGAVISVRPTRLEEELRPMAHRYFGRELGDRYVESSGDENSLVFTMRPERWRTVDYRKHPGAPKE
jgi:hypothetical protein